MYFKHYCSLSMVITNIRSRKINTPYLLITKSLSHSSSPSPSSPPSSLSRSSWQDASATRLHRVSLQVRLRAVHSRLPLGHHHHHHHHYCNYHDSQDPSYKFSLVIITITITIIAVMTTYKNIHTSFPLVIITITDIIVEITIKSRLRGCS